MGCSGWRCAGRPVEFPPAGDGAWCVATEGVLEVIAPRAARAARAAMHGAWSRALHGAWHGPMPAPPYAARRGAVPRRARGRIACAFRAQVELVLPPPPPSHADDSDALISQQEFDRVLVRRPGFPIGRRRAFPHRPPPSFFHRPRAQRAMGAARRSSAVAMERSVGLALSGRRSSAARAWARPTGGRCSCCCSAGAPFPLRTFPPRSFPL